jgi:hypothetical protein
VNTVVFRVTTQNSYARAADLYRSSIANWRNTEHGQWVVDHALEVRVETFDDIPTDTTRVAVIARLWEDDLIIHNLRFL